MTLRFLATGNSQVKNNGSCRLKDTWCHNYDILELFTLATLSNIDKNTIKHSGISLFQLPHWTINSVLYFERDLCSHMGRTSE